MVRSVYRHMAWYVLVSLFFFFLNVSTAATKHHDQGNLEKKVCNWGWLPVSQGQSLVIMVGSVRAYMVRHNHEVVTTKAMMRTHPTTQALVTHLL